LKSSLNLGAMSIMVLLKYEIFSPASLRGAVAQIGDELFVSAKIHHWFITRTGLNRDDSADEECAGIS
jgi:hypothetical protein